MTSKYWRRIAIGILLFVLIISAVSQIHTPMEAALAAPNAPTVVLGGDRIRLAPPTAADLNANGRQEIVVAAEDGMIYVVAYVGSSWSKVWQRQTADDLNAVLPAPEQQADGLIEAAPAIGDIDNDGDLEIVISTGGTPNGGTPSLNRNGGIIAYELVSDAGTNWSFSVKSGWPFLMPDTMGAGVGARDPDGVRDGIPTTPTLGDIDGDDDLEIISMALDRTIRAFHHDGSVVAGWPIERDNGDILLRGGRSSAAIGDIDNDGLNEIVIGTNSPPWNGDNKDGPFPPLYNDPDYTLATVWALNGDSSLVPGWPVITEQVIKSSPALGDIDGDGELEIVVGSGNFNNYQGGQEVYAWNADGTTVSGWPRPTPDYILSSPALADLDGNGVLDVIIGCGMIADQDCKNLYAWDGSGNDLPGFPINTGHANPFPPIVADIDGDNQLEILQTSLASTSISVIQHNGSNSAIDTSRSTGNVILNSPLVADGDGDGDLETIVAGANGSNQAAVYIFEESSSTDTNLSSLPWPMFQRDAAHTGIFLLPRLSFLNEIRVFHQQGSGNSTMLDVLVTNSGGGEFDWDIDTNGTGGDVTVDTASGTLIGGDSTPVTFTIDTTSCTGWCNLGDIVVSGTSGGEDVNDSPQSVTVWLFVGDVSHAYLPMTIK